MEITLGKRIVHHRKRLGLTQDQLAEKLGVTAQAVSKWENDQSCPDITMLPRLAEIFGVSVDTLLGVETVPVHEAEVVDETAKPGKNGNKDRGKWEIHVDGGGRRGALGFACWVLLLGVLLLIDNILQLNAGFWSLAWPSFLLMGGIFFGRKFSFFRLGCVLFGGYFLLDAFGLIPFDLGSGIIWPVLVLLFGLSLLADALRKPKKEKPGYQFSVCDDEDIHREKVSRFDVHEDSFECENSFGDERYDVRMELLRLGRVENNFGSTTVDLSGVGALGDECRMEAESNFGQIVLLVPRRFCVRLSSETAFASVTTKGEPDETVVGTIHMTCSANFGSVEIRYI